MHVEATWLLAEALREQGRFGASAAAVQKLALQPPINIDIVIACVQWMTNCTRQREASELVEAALRLNLKDPRLFALSGQLSLVLGNFGLARKRLMAALDAGIDQSQWFILQALTLTQRYIDPSHPDREKCSRALTTKPLDPLACASIHYARAKLLIDVDEITPAVADLREANRLCREHFRWSRSEWSQFVDARQVRRMPLTQGYARPGFIPIFILGLPRTGTSLVADCLSRDTRVCNRGESGVLAYLAQQFINSRSDQYRLDHAEAFYYTRLRQDDEPAEFYIDKNPVNFRYLDHVAQLFPQARVIYCQRNLRDTAISIFSQYFGNPANGFAYDFADIAAYAAGAKKLMRHWQKTLPLEIHYCDYERLVDEPDMILRELRRFVGLSDVSIDTAPSEIHTVIATASAWQARQPVHRGSIGRWRRFAADLPEMVEAIPDEDAVA